MNEEDARGSRAYHYPFVSVSGSTDSEVVPSVARVFAETVDERSSEDETADQIILQIDRRTADDLLRLLLIAEVLSEEGADRLSDLDAAAWNRLYGVLRDLEAQLDSGD